MKTSGILRLALLPLALGLAGASFADNMSGAEYSAAKKQIKADYKVAKAACDKLDGNAEDICEAEAKGKEKIAEAELQHRRSATSANARKLALAKADADYEVAKERCDDSSGDAKDACMKEAEAAEARAKAEAKKG